MTSIDTGRRAGGRMNLGLWIVQGLLAAFYGMVGVTKLSRPLADLDAMMGGWPSQLPTLVRVIGACETAAAVGLILPLATGILPRLTPLAALGLAVLQVCAMVFHVARGEPQVLPVNLVLLALAAFVAWGRGVRRP